MVHCEYKIITGLFKLKLGQHNSTVVVFKFVSFEKYLNSSFFCYSECEGMELNCCMVTKKRWKVRHVVSYRYPFSLNPPGTKHILARQAVICIFCLYFYETSEETSVSSAGLSLELAWFTCLLTVLNCSSGCQNSGNFNLFFSYIPHLDQKKAYLSLTHFKEFAF